MQVKLIARSRAMTLFSFAAGLFMAATSCYAQATNSGTSSTASRESVEDRLVQLALNKSYANKAMVYEAEVARAEMRQTKSLWLDHFMIQGNLNEFTLQPDRYVRSQFFPRYNFSVA